MSDFLQVKKKVLFTCQHVFDKTYYKVRIKVVSFEQAVAKQLGFEGLFDSVLRSSTMKITDILRKKIKLFELNKKVHVVAKPVLQVQSGYKSYTKTGGEIPFYKVDHRYGVDKSLSLIWKDYGLKVHFIITPSTKGNILLNYDMLLKSPSKSSRESFQSNQLKSQVRIPLNEEFLVGGLEYTTESEKTDGTFILKDLPIFSPFFKLSSNEGVATNLYLSFQVTLM